MPAPVNVASLITGATYPAVVPVTSDTSVFTEAEHINTIVSLGDRIEFVRRLTSLAGAAPETFLLIRDDFLAAVYDAGNNLLYSDLIWKTAIGAGTPAISLNTGTAKNPGNVVVSLPAGATADQLSVALGSMTAATFTFAGFDRTVFVFGASDNVGNPGTQFQAGICQNAANLAVGAGGTDSLRVRYSKADSANWLINIRKASAPTQVDSGVPFVSGENIVAMFARNAAAGIDVSINGALITTIAAANVPAGSGTPCFEAFKSGADVFSCNIKVDLFNGLQVIADRKGA